jgi:hypothetical protein
MRKGTPVTIDIGLHNGPLILHSDKLLGLRTTPSVVVTLHQLTNQFVLRVEIVERGGFVHFAKRLPH